MHYQAEAIKKLQVTEANGEKMLQALIYCNLVIMINDDSDNDSDKCYKL